MALILGKRNKVFKLIAGWCKRFIDGLVVGPFKTRFEADNAAYPEKKEKKKKKFVPTPPMPPIAIKKAGEK